LTVKLNQHKFINRKYFVRVWLFITPATSIFI